MKNFDYAKMGAIIAIIICIALLLGSALTIRAYGEEPVIEDTQAGAQLLNPGHSGINIHLDTNMFNGSDVTVKVNDSSVYNGHGNGSHVTVYVDGENILYAGDILDIGNESTTKQFVVGEKEGNQPTEHDKGRNNYNAYSVEIPETPTPSEEPDITPTPEPSTEPETPEEPEVTPEPPSVSPTVEPEEPETTPELPDVSPTVQPTIEPTVEPTTTPTSTPAPTDLPPAHNTTSTPVRPDGPPKTGDLTVGYIILIVTLGLWSLIGIVFIIKELINDKRKH